MYFNKKSEMTAAAQTLIKYGTLVAYRVRTTCACKEPQNRRNGILIVDKSTNQIVYKLIRCKACRKETVK